MNVTTRIPSADVARLTWQLAILLLVGLGTVMVFSSTGYARSLELNPVYLGRHLVFLLVGGTGCYVVGRLPRSLLLRLAPWLFLLGVALLLLVLLPGFGSRINGARRWFRVGPLSLQPAEFMKILLPLFLAWWSLGHQAGRRWWRELVGLTMLVAVPLLIALQPDLGTSLLVFGMGACYLFLSGWPLRIFVAGLFAVIPALGWLMIYRPYQWTRVSDYLQALGHWEQAQYQVKQSLLSIGSGDFLGTGLGLGLQKLSFLPESHTDFIFAVIGEELGLVGTWTVIALWLIVLLAGTRLIQRISDQPELYALAGTLLFGLVGQALVNTCVVTSLLPPKGISHPLLSYGGSNLLTTLLACGLILNLTRTAPSVLQPTVSAGECDAGVDSRPIP
ncbi:MAG: FtsW/RodA/SpoVE family cell cycle protein [Planctomycetaceae bacterium]|nr:FtsW/RodA/SpoVE family cell cycle protein [Planctomycetaceae bacterium]